MLKKLSVNNFMGFNGEIVLDFKAHTYSFNSNLIKDKLVNKAIIYGKNGTGKTNLGLAIFDIYYMLTDGNTSSLQTIKNYSNLNNESNVVTFKYEFLFDKKIITYVYKKYNLRDIISEELLVNDKVLLHFDINEDHNLFVNKIKTHNKINFRPYVSEEREWNTFYNVSILKYIYRGDVFDESTDIYKLFNFVDRMLWVRSLNKGNEFMGNLKYLGTLDAGIIKDGKVKEFQEFLKNNDINLEIEPSVFDNHPFLMAKFKKGSASLDSIISSGTSYLRLYFYWSLYFDEISFLYLDEFDAFYHYETAEFIMKDLLKYNNMQTVLTTHNLTLMNNDLVRPDTCFIINDNQIKCLKELTDKELREAHNLSKLYMNGAFDE